MTLQQIQSRAVEIKHKYDSLNKRSSQNQWDEQAIMAGFVGDVGDLSKIIMAKSNLRDIQDVDNKLAHELSDCLWCIAVLSDMYNIDLASEFQKNMYILDEKINTKLTLLS